ncbi:MutS-related protein, partial [Simonsiella muelleri]|uniref:MutS-related protein n=1 Tax=Simonsiella muelleri TaxID=72 RepID=UPI003C6EAED1
SVVNMHLSALEQGKDIVFLHHVQAGAAEKSYGIAVAKLAGLPPRALKAAQKQLAVLEAQTAQPSLQLDMFAPESESVLADEPDFRQPENDMRILQNLRDINPDELTARQALEWIYQWKETLSE